MIPHYVDDCNYCGHPGDDESRCQNPPCLYFGRYIQPPFEAAHFMIIHIR